MSKAVLQRKFVLEKNNNKIVLDDPDPSMSADEVLNSYSAIYPELVTSSVIGPEYEDDKIIYRFKTTVGTKG